MLVSFKLLLSVVGTPPMAGMGSWEIRATSVFLRMLATSTCFLGFEITSSRGAWRSVWRTAMDWRTCAQNRSRWLLGPKGDQCFLAGESPELVPSSATWGHSHSCHTLPSVHTGTVWRCVCALFLQGGCWKWKPIRETEFLAFFTAAVENQPLKTKGKAHVSQGRSEFRCFEFSKITPHLEMRS